MGMSELASSLRRDADQALALIGASDSLDDVDMLRRIWLGKQGRLVNHLKSLGGMSQEERGALAPVLHAIKADFQHAIQDRINVLQAAEQARVLAEEACDVTLPGRHGHAGCLHPLTSSIRHLVSFFVGHGYVHVDGPALEDDFHNFTALNIPKTHPARAMHDTFYCDDGQLLRTHTSPVQLRAMRDAEPPCRFVSAGPVFRKDSDQTHTPMFHQLEVMSVGPDVHMGHMRELIDACLKSFFGSHIRSRFRPSYFPFTEPSAEVDMSCPFCAEQVGCRVCQHTGWLEVLGCGMIHPNVMEHLGFDSDTLQGFAFGCGIERLTMIRRGVSDLRTFYENDVRFLHAF